MKDDSDVIPWPDEVPKIEPEYARAARHKKALVDALEAVRQVAEAARLDGFYVEFGLNMDAFGRYTINPPAGLIKRF